MKKINNKGAVMIYITFIIMAFIIIFIAAFAIPMGIRFNTEMYKAGEKIINDANQSLEGIQNETMRAQIRAVLNTGLSGIKNNIEVNTALFKYSWIIVLGLTALVMFIYTRRLVEYGGGIV